MSMLLDSAGLFEPLAERLADGLPTFGTCAGMILLGAEILDGRPDQRCLGAVDIAVRRNAFGRQVDSFERDITLAGDVAEGPFRAVFIRAPWVEQTGPGVAILGTDLGTGRIVAVRQGQLLATAFHPELTPDRRIHQLFVDIVKDKT
jgi:5'-phosphate synthase pdxT subunit